MHHHTGCQLTTGPLFPFRQRKANRFQNTQTLAVLGHAVQIHHLIEWQGCRLTLQAAIAFRTPGALDTYLALDNSLARQKLYLPYRCRAGNVQNGGRRLCEHHFPFYCDQFFQHRRTAHPGQGLQLLFNAAVRQRSDQLCLVLCMKRDHQPIGPAHLDAVRVHGPAVEIFGLAFHHGRPAGEGKFRHFQLFCKGQLLFGLA